MTTTTVKGTGRAMTTLNGNLISEMNTYKVIYQADGVVYTTIVKAATSYEATRPWLRLETISVEKLGNA